MADKEIATLTAASTLTGAEIIHGVQSANSRKITTQNIANLNFGQETIWMPAGFLEGRKTTAGAILKQTEIPTSLLQIRSLSFPTASNTYCGASIQMPKSWDLGTLICQFVWYTDGSQTSGLDGVKWYVRAGAYASNDSLSTALGTAVGATAQNHSATINDMMITAETAALTVAGSPAAEELVYFEAYRDTADAGDDLDIDAELIGMKVHYTTNAGNDS